MCKVGLAYISVFGLVLNLVVKGVFNFFLGEVLSADCTQEQNCNKKILHLNGYGINKIY